MKPFAIETSLFHEVLDFFAFTDKHLYAISKEYENDTNSGKFDLESKVKEISQKVQACDGYEQDFFETGLVLNHIVGQAILIPERILALHEFMIENLDKEEAKETAILETLSCFFALERIICGTGFVGLPGENKTYGNTSQCLFVMQVDRRIPYSIQQAMSSLMAPINELIKKGEPFPDSVVDGIILSKEKEIKEVCVFLKSIPEIKQMTEDHEFHKNNLVLVSGNWTLADVYKKGAEKVRHDVPAGQRFGIFLQTLLALDFLICKFNL